ncbi:MAG: hypothetical protein Unbinned1693contig1002_11 [Prokaryotic dsDNA virus sp.]|jgi:hypothetical protein|nr:MAG: hypothetical protein Unbinned1693contig1002_11 [Prokaryotic dsDNA virus sp.]|tara:strand:+ start:10048 stop:10263 length:216 start_codon:yes stop_codon:yes gene_type:complete
MKRLSKEVKAKLAVSKLRPVNMIKHTTDRKCECGSSMFYIKEHGIDFCKLCVRCTKHNDNKYTEELENANK